MSFFFVSTHARIMIINYILSVIQSQKCRAERFVELLKNKRMALLSFGWHGELSGDMIILQQLAVVVVG